MRATLTDAFAEQLANRLGGVLDFVYHTDPGVTVYLTPRGAHGRQVTFSPDDRSLGMGTWVACVMDGNEFDEDNSSESPFGNECRNLEQIAEWVELVKARLANN